MGTKSQKTTPTDKKTTKKTIEEDIQKSEMELILEQMELEKSIRKKEIAEINRRWNKTSKPYTQTSKKVVGFCLIDFLIVEIFAMIMIWRTGDTEQIMYLITSIAITCLGAVIWYMKNSEAEKKARINMELERLKMSKAFHSESCNDDDIDVDVDVNVGDEDDFDS